jgi:signal transduction histidine kinase
MSHELRTPLNSVIALSGVLNRRLRGTVPAEEHGYLEIIERNGKQLLALINDILDLSRIEAGKEELSLGHFSIRELVGEVAATLDPQAREKKIALRNLVGARVLPLHELAAEINRRVCAGSHQADSSSPAGLPLEPSPGKVL